VAGILDLNKEIYYHFLSGPYKGLKSAIMGGRNSWALKKGPIALTGHSTFNYLFLRII